MKKTPLASRHHDLGARLLPFAGWEMPIQYAGIVAEHLAVRDGLGIFDISHMGQFTISGSDSEEWLNSLLTNDVSTLTQGGGQYTLMLNEKGGVIDDMILYREGVNQFFLVVNAAKIEEDWNWLQSQIPEGVEMEDLSEQFGAVAVQGPDAEKAWEQLFSEEKLPPRNGISRTQQGMVVCRTGYTGEDGFELFASLEQIGELWDRFIEAGATPCGLGARDTLRLEKCYPLNGSDLDEVHTPLEAGLGFFVKMDKTTDFVGKSALSTQKEKGLARKLTALRAVGKGPPPRHGYEVTVPGEDEVLSELTSGGLSPSLQLGIGLAYLPLEHSRVGTRLDVLVRGRAFPFEVVKKPFV